MTVNAAGPDAEEQQDVRQQPDADVHKQIHKRVGRELTVQERKNEVADQCNAAQNRHNQIQTEAGVAVEPVGKDQQRRHKQQQIENLPRAVEAAAQHSAQHQQNCRGPDGHQHAEMAVRRFLQKKEVERPGHHNKGAEHKSNDFIQHRRPVNPRRGGGKVRLPCRAGQAVLAQRAVGAVPADLDMTMRAGIHFSTSVA